MVEMEVHQMGHATHATTVGVPCIFNVVGIPVIHCPWLSCRMAVMSLLNEYNELHGWLESL